MTTNLDSFFKDKIDNEKTTKIDKVLCIVEGGDELSFIKRVYEVYNDSIECDIFFNKKIKLSYGRGLIEWQGNSAEEKTKNRKRCNFKGGDNQEKAPLPILASLNNEDLEIYKAIIIMFDKDRDLDDFVETESKNILKKYNQNIIFLSTPCFEKETVTFFDNNAIQKYIEKYYSIIDSSECLWYKQNYGKILKLNPIENKKKLSTIIPVLTNNHFESLTINKKMNELILFIRNHI